MTGTRVLSLCVGISGYPHSLLEPGETPLRFLAKSATDLSAIFNTMWPGEAPERKHLLALNEDATISKLEALLIGEKDQYDLFVLYLAGHGRTRSSGFQFLLYGNNLEEALIDSKEIDNIGLLAPARNCLLLLDACYSGQFLAETDLFGQSAQASAARICIASSRAEQRSWEDVHFENSLFAHAVGETLTEGAHDPAISRAVRSVFSDVAASVTRNAFALKGGVAQEPVVSGFLIAAFELPKAAANTTNRASLSTFEVLAKRSRQIVGIAVLSLTCFLLILFLVTWRPEINTAGKLEIRAGPKWLSPLNVGSWTRRLELDLSRDDLRSEARNRVQDEDGTFLWSGMGHLGVRRWADVFVNNFLLPDKAIEWRIRLGDPKAVGDLTRPILDTGAGILRIMTSRVVRKATTFDAAELAAEATILNSQSTTGDTWKVEWQQLVVLGSCTGQPLNERTKGLLDFYVYTVPESDFVRWLYGLQRTAVVDQAVGFEQVALLIEMFNSAHSQWQQGYSAAATSDDAPLTPDLINDRFSERPSLREQDGLVGLARAIVQRRSARSEGIVSRAERMRLGALMANCADLTAPVLAVLGDQGDINAVMKWSHDQKKAAQGRRALDEFARQRLLTADDIASVLNEYGSQPRLSQSAFVDTRDWLSKIADWQPLPSAVESQLLTYASERIQSDDEDNAYRALGLVVRNQSDRAVDRLAQALLGKLAKMEDGLPLSDSAVDTLSLLARSGADVSADWTDDVLSLAKDSLTRITYTKGDLDSSPDYQQLVAGPTYRDVLAFARLVLGARSKGFDNAAALLFMTTAISDAFQFGVSPARMREVIAADAKIWLKLSGRYDLTELGHKLKNDTASDRETWVEIAVAALAENPPEKRARLLQSLRNMWVAEQEPQTKMALAEIIVRCASESDNLRKIGWFPRF